MLPHHRAPFTYYVLDENKQVRATDYHEWAHSWADPAARIVAHTSLGPGQYVRTFFIGFDRRENPAGPPLVFKTIVMGGHFGRDEYFHATWAEALQDHIKLFERITEAARMILARKKRSLHLVTPKTRRPPQKIEIPRKDPERKAM